jgi:hypothetical protein
VQQLAIKKRQRLQEEYKTSMDIRLEYETILNELRNTVLPLEASALDKSLNEIVEKYVKPVEQLPDNFSQQMYYVDRDEWQTGSTVLWDFTKSSVAYAYWNIGQRTKMLESEIEAMNKLTGENSMGTWRLLDTKYLRLVDTIDKYVEELALDTQQTYPVEKARIRDSLPVLADREEALLAAAAELKPPVEILFYQIATDTQELKLRVALLRLGITESLANELVLSLYSSALELRTRFEETYFRKVGKVLKAMWNEYKQAIAREMRLSIVEQRFINLLNAIFLLAGKRLGTNKRLEKQFESSSDRKVNRIIRQTLDELGTPESPGPRANISFDTVRVDAQLDCDSCAQSVSSYVCSGCSTAVYCSAACQGADWTAHEPLCMFLNE